MKKYLYIVKMAVMDSASYPVRFFGNLFKDGLTLVIFLFLWRTLYGSKEEVAGYTLASIVTYYAISIAVRSVINTRSVSREVEDGVKNGQLAAILIKPLNYNLYVFNSLTTHNLIRALTPAAVVAVLTYYVPVFIPSNHLMLFFLSYIFAIIISFLFHSILGTMAFWLVNTWGIRSLSGRIISLLSGSVVPLAFFPTWLVTLNSYLPFKHMVDTPIVVYLGQVDLLEIYRMLLSQIVWVGILLVFHAFFWKAAIKQFDSVGN